MRQNELKKSRNFTYITTKDKYPLQLTGNMKKRIVNSSNKQNDCVYSMKPSQKDKLLTKISQNYSDLKSIIPKQISHAKDHQVVQKATKDNNRMSGIAYLVSKQEKNPLPVRGRKQVKSKSELAPPQSIPKKEGKKTFTESQKPQIKEPQLRPHSETLKRKINNDLHTNFLAENRQSCEKDSSLTARSQSNRLSVRNMQGEFLGYERSRPKVLCDAKKREILGSINQSKNKYADYLNTEKVKTGKGNYRQDYMKSTFQLG